MAEETSEMKKFYEEHLKPDDYHEAIVDALTEMRSEFSAVLENLHKTWKSGDYKGNRLLEIGSGATVHNIASASAYFKEIIQSDFVSLNCEELRKWLKGESDLDWTDFLKIVAGIEGYSDVDQGVSLLTSRIQKCVKDVVHCDVTSDQVVPPEVGKDFDAIISCLILEAAAIDFNSYVDILKRMHGLLRPGGVLVMVGFLNGAKWKVGENEFHHIRLNESDVNHALEIAKFNIKEFLIFPKGLGDPGYEYDNLYFATSVSI